MSKQLGAKLKQLRIENGLTQTYVGAKLNIGNKTISDYERGISEPDTTVLKELARLYGISIDELLDNKPINSTTSGERLKELRIEKRLTLRELADKLSMSYSNIAMIERGERNFSSDSLKSFCDFFNVSSDYLLGLSNQQNDIKTNNLKELRANKGLTLRELSENINIDKSTLSRYERQEQEIKSSDLLMLAKYYNVPIDYLLCNNTAHPKDELTDELHNTIDKLNKGNKEFILKLAKTLIKEQ